MTGAVGPSLIDLLHASNPDIDRIVSTFVACFNATYGSTGTDGWDITKEDWQRYEFLGDRVLNLIVAQSLFTCRDGGLNEGEMTRRLSSLVSNRALDALTQPHQKTFTCLIPAVIGEQNAYGERITGGAFEAFVGALYCEVGLDDVAYFVTTLMGEAPGKFNPEENAIGQLQEYFQKTATTVPHYREKSRTGPDHRPAFTYEVLIKDVVLGEGSGETIRQAQQAAARVALDRIRDRDNPSKSS